MVLPKIHKHLFNVPGRPVIANCETRTKKVSEYFDFCLKPIIQNGWSYVKDSNDFKNKIKSLGNLSGNITLVAVYVVAFYPSIPHEGNLETLRERLVKSEGLKLFVDIVKTAEFVLNNKIIQFNGRLSSKFRKQQLILNFLHLMHAFTWMIVFW